MGNVNRYYIGIDPGLKGYLAAIKATRDGWEYVSAIKMPFAKKTTLQKPFIDYAALDRWFFGKDELMSNGSYDFHVVIEQAVSGVGQAGSRVTSFAIGFNYGALLAYFIDRKIPFSVVPVATWQACIIPRKKTTVDDSKTRAKKAVEICFSDKTKTLAEKHLKHDGFIDALLLAYYCATGRKKI